MLKLINSACIDKSPEEVWKVLSNVENIPQWSEAVLAAKCTGDLKQGIGTKRVCTLSNNMTIEEVWTHWEEEVSFTYEAHNLPLVELAINTWKITPLNGKTLLISEATVQMKGGLFGKLLEPLMKIMTKKMGENAMSAFKYLVEEGVPYEGKHSRLPRAPITC